MEGGDGMVAVIREIRESGLAVTLLDGSRQYTLMPKPVTQQQLKTGFHGSHVNGSSQRSTLSNMTYNREPIMHRDTAAQATDEHYVSMYKMAHCNVTPTAPPVHLSEFPPQRAELSPGSGSFEVGGRGSGETYSPVRISRTYRGGMNWPDRGSVCSPRLSQEPDAFANSLRRYPTLSPDRSEVVERLISYTQARNSSKTYQPRTQISPTRSTEGPSNIMDRSQRSSRGYRSYEHEVNVRTRSKIDESPTRDSKPKKDYEFPDCKRSIYTRNYDVRYLREFSRRSKDSTKSVNTETQAVVEMVTREVSTLPRIEPDKKTVAIPLTPTSSTALQQPEGKHLETSYKSVYTSFSALELNKNLKRLKSVQTCSSIDLVDTKKLENDRRTKSQEELRTDALESEIVRLLEEVVHSDLSDKNKMLREELNKRFNKNEDSLHKTTNAGGRCASNKLKANTFDSMDNIIIDGHSESKGPRLNRQIDLLLRKSKFDCNGCKRNVLTDKTKLKEYIRNELSNFFDKSHIEINTECLEELEITLTDGLMNSVDILENSDQLRDEILNIMTEFSDISHQKALNFANLLIINLKDSFCVHDYIRKENTFIVLQSTCKNSPEQTNTNEFSDFSISAINEKDIQANLDFYIKELTQQIDQWLTNLGIHEDDKNFRQVVVNDLATDIVDRHKYLELNTSSQGTEEAELEHLKYQIFKWINKLVGEENTNTLDHASDLMKRIQSIPVPMLTKFGQSNNSNLPDCCQKGSKIPVKSDFKSNEDGQINQKSFQDSRQTRNVCPGSMNISQMPIFGSPGLGGSMTQSSARSQSSNRRHSAPEGYNTNTSPNFKNMEIRPMPICQPTIGDLTMNDGLTPGLMNISEQMPSLNGRGANKNAGPASSKFRQPACCQSLGNTEEISKNQKPGPSTKQSSLNPGCCPPKQSSLKPTFQEIDKDFDAYLRQWVKKIPITDATPEEVTQMQELLVNNVYKIIAIVKCNPEVLSNSFLYQDLLEEQIDALFEQLSPSSELMPKLHALKIELLEKITSTEKEIKKTVLTLSYRSQLLENIKNNTPGADKMYAKQDHYAEFNDLKDRENIADNFILQTYFTDDRVKSNVYKMRVSKGIHTMIRDISQSQKLPLNLDASVNSLLASLYNVPIPPEEQLKLEANQILLAQEVDQWLIDLPMSEPDRVLVEHQKRVLRDGIVRKIYEIESKNIDNCMVEEQLKQEVLKAIERIPMNSKDVDINFMVDELVNRLKNRSKDIPRRKSVSFNDSTINYEDFGRTGMICSSYNEIMNNDSYYIVGGEKRDLNYFQNNQPTPQYLVPQGKNQNSHSTEFYSMEESSYPAYKMYDKTNHINGNRQGLCCNTSQDQQNLAQPYASANPGMYQQIPCEQPMSQSQRDAMSNQSVYIPIPQGPCGNTSEAPQILTQPHLVPASTERTHHMTYGQPILPMHQDQVAPQHSIYVPIPPVSCGHTSQNQQDPTQLTRPGSQGRATTIGNNSRSQVPQSGHVQQTASACCRSPQQGYQHQINSAPEPICGNTAQIQRLDPNINKTLHTRQRAGSNEMHPGQALHSSLPCRSGVTQSSQRAEYGLDPCFLNPCTAQGMGKQMTASQLSTDPVANSTPQCQLQTDAVPPKVAKKRTKVVDRNAIEQEVSDEDDEDECRCIEKLLRHRRRRPIFLPCDNYDDPPRCYHIMYPFPCFF